MNSIWDKDNLIYRVGACLLIVLHLITFGPIRDAFAFSASSVSYKLNAGALSEGGASRSAASTKLWQDVIGEPCTGQAQSQNFILNSGFIPIIQSNPPILTQDIPYQIWAVNTGKPNAFDLDDYFISPDGYPLNFSVLGNSKINITIDPDTHIVSFSQTVDWYGVEKIYFQAVDSEGSITQSNEVVLQVQSPVGQPNKPIIISSQISPSPAKEGDLVILTVKAYDLDNQNLTFSYGDFFSETRHWKEGNFWYSEATWQAPANSNGHYNTRVTVSDGALTDTSSVTVNIGNFNHPPVLDNIPDITANEDDLVTITPHAADSDNDPVVFYYSAPFDYQGKWLTGYDDSGTYNIQVTASDGIDTVSKIAKVIINNTNRAPQVNLILSSYTVKPNEQINISLSATDPDGDAMTFSLNKDGTQIASGNLANTYTSSVSFSNIANHTISATVTDSAGLSATASRGVDVADPNANRDSINPVMGDFNGDALTDLGLHNSDTGTWEVCLSDKGTFRNAVSWLAGFGTSRDWWPIGGDFNGDGKTDIGIYNNTTGELKAGLSSGSGFLVQDAAWLSFPSASYSWQPFTGNFNADKYTDFGLYNKDTGEVKIALGTGSGFGALTAWSTGFGTGYIALSGDFNADGLSDLGLFKKSSGEFKVAFSNSSAFVDGASWISGYAVDKDVLISDFNNDGLTDIGYWDKAGGSWYYAISIGSSFVDKGIWLAGFGQSDDESATTGDFDGNGITDAACFDKDQLGINRWTTRLSTDKPADLLAEINNGIGGKTKVIYTYAATSDNSGLPFPVYVASDISLVNTFPAERSASYSQHFNFSGGYYDAQEREFRGFAKVRISDPITNNYSETYFYQGKDGQDGALKGQIDKIIAYDGNARKISQSQNTYDVKKSGPQDKFLGFPALIETDVTVWEENGTSLSTKNLLTYDNIGNVLEENQEGDILKTGDEKSSATTYAQAYETGFNRPLEALLKDKDGNIVTKKNFEYDNKGNLTKETAWLNLQDAQPSTQYAYDSFGNLTSSTNALGSTVTTDYETDFYTYPEKVANSLGQSIQYVYEPRFGVVRSTTDANGNTSSTTYDSFGRPLQVKNAYSQIVTTFTYPDFNTKTTTNALGLFKTEYVDGLGRKYKTISSAEDGVNQNNISSEVFYNDRGLTDSETLAHYVDEDPGQISYTRYEYDIRGRIKKTIADFPGSSFDAQSSINYLNPLYVETTDPLGHRKGTLKDIYGNIVEITEFTSDGIFKTKYEYDNQNNLVKTTDNQNNIVQIFYDSLGRKTKMIDPDMGTWAYEYDLAGNLRKQTDAKGQILEFNYDTLNRLTEKQGLSPQGTVPVSLAIYSYDDSSKDYCVGRLSKVTDQSGSAEFFYDKLGRETKSIKTVDGNPYVVLREYDVLDRLTKLTYPDSEAVNYSYDSNSGLLESVKGLSPQGTVPYVQDTSYNAKGQIKNISYGNNTHTNYTYGPDLRLSRILTQGAANLQDLNYLFDKNGNVTTLTDNLRSNIRTYTYDDLSRLTQANNIPSPSGGYSNFYYRYDSIGNMTYKSDVGTMAYGEGLSPQGTVPKPHALTSANGYAYQYDANGNMIVGKNKTLSYDAENRLMQVNEPGATTSFVYDGDGGRVKRASLRGGVADEAIYIGSLFEKDSSGKITKHIFAGANRVASVITRPEGAKQSMYYHSDHLGSSNVISDSAGNLLQRCEYTPYGSIAVNEGTESTNYKFTGKELDSTGLYFYGARYYDPEIGRFITADTIVQAPYDSQSLNRYSYCRNNPINYVDPTGHWFWVALIVGAILGGASAAASGQPIWQGALLGAAGGLLVGGGAAAFGFWGAVGGGMLAGAGTAGATGGNIGFGALVGGLGAGIGYGLGSWASNWESGSFWGELGGAMMAGVVAGGVGSELSGGNFGQGAWMGAAYGSAGFFGSKAVNGLDQRARQLQRAQREARARHALNSKKNDMIKVPISSRDVSFFKPAGHQSMPGFEMGPDASGYIKTTRTVADLSKWSTNIETQAAGSGRGQVMAEVSASGLVDSQAWYEQNFVNTNTKYSPISGNSNFAINTVIYSSGGSVPNAPGWNPSFGSVPNSVFYPYSYRED